jgi:Mitochondrial import receptor subunit Tom22
MWSRGLSRIRTFTSYLYSFTSYASFLGDTAWFLASSTLLIALPVLVEMQRETTVLVMQREKEIQMKQMRDQITQMNMSMLDQTKAIAGSLLGAGPQPPAAQ